MPVRVRCRCGQEFVLRYREWIYFLLGLLVLCLLVNTVVLLLLYLRLEQGLTARRFEAPAQEPVAGVRGSGTVAWRTVAGDSEPAERAERHALVEKGPAGETDAAQGTARESAPAESSAATRRGEATPGEKAAGETAGVEEVPLPASEGPAIALAPRQALRSEESLFKELSPLSFPPEQAHAPLAGGQKQEPGPADDGGPPGTRRLIEEEALLRLLVLEGAADEFPLVCAFFLDPDPSLRRRAVELALTASAPASSEAAARLKFEALEPLLLRAAPVLRADGLEREFLLLCRERFPGLKRFEDGGRLDPPPPWADSGLSGSWDSCRETALKLLRGGSAEALRAWLLKVKTGGLDVAILLDVSQSMEDALGAFSQEADWLLPALEWSLPGLEVALVLYRDEVVTVEDLSPAPASKLSPILRQVKGEGGGDVPEGVHVALKAALSLGHIHWRKEAQKQLFIIGDAPPPFAHVRQLLSLVRQAHVQAGYRLHALSINPEEGRQAVAFFPELAAAAGGRAVTARPEGLGGEIFKCLLAPECEAAADSLLAAMRALFRRGG